MIFHLDGFDSYAAVADLSMEYTDDNLAFYTTGGRFGGGAFAIEGGNLTFLQKSVPAANVGLVSFWSGFAMEVVAHINSDQPILTIVSAMGDETTITLNNTSGVFKAWTGDLSSVYATSTSFTVGTGAWHWVEIFFTLSSSVGAVQIWVDQRNLLSLSGLNTTGPGGTSIVAIAIGTPHNTSACQARYDDWYLIDPRTGPNTAQLGDSAVTTDVPNSDAGPNNGVPSTGTDHFACVDEPQWSSAKSLTIADTSGQSEIFGFPALGITTSNIWAVRSLNVAEETLAGGADAEAVVRSASATLLGANTPLLTTFSHVYAVANVDPNTGAQWTVSGVNAVNIGFEIP